MKAERTIKDYQIMNAFINNHQLTKKNCSESQMAEIIVIRSLIEIVSLEIFSEEGRQK